MGPGSRYAVAVLAAGVWALTIVSTVAFTWLVVEGPRGERSPIHVTVTIPQAVPAHGSGVQTAGAMLEKGRSQWLAHTEGRPSDAFGDESAHSDDASRLNLAGMLRFILEAAGSPPLDPDLAIEGGGVRELREQLRRRLAGEAELVGGGSSTNFRPLAEGVPRTRGSAEGDTLRALLADLNDPAAFVREPFGPGMLDELGIALGQLQAQFQSIRPGFGGNGLSAGLAPLAELLETVEEIMQADRGFAPFASDAPLRAADGLQDWRELPVERRRALLFLALAAQQWPRPVLEDS